VDAVYIHGMNSRPDALEKMVQCSVPENEACLVRRSIALPGVSDPRIGGEVRAELSRLAGMSEVRVQGRRRRVCVTYDASRLNFGQIERALAQAGCSASNGHWSRIKAVWYRWVDDTTRANASAPEAACCNNPPKVPASRPKG
jgi:hypothetical protein